MNSDTLAVKSIIEHTSQLGISTGIVSTSAVTHATPASFYAHTKSRNQQEEIASYLPNSSVDFFAGGGKDFFFKRKDKINYGSVLEEKGFVLDTIALKKPSDFGLQQKFGFLLANNSMPSKIDGRDDFLPNATQLALDYLSQNKKGFFLMVEGSQIDWGGHGNNADYIIQEVLDFDKAIGSALDFAEKEGNTLVIVTADHETGGYSLASDDGNYNKIKSTFSTNGHTATLIPVFAYGSGAKSFMGIYENNAIFYKIKKLLDW